MGVHTCHPNPETGRQEEQKFRVTFDNTVSCGQSDGMRRGFKKVKFSDDNDDDDHIINSCFKCVATAPSASPRTLQNRQAPEPHPHVRHGVVVQRVIKTANPMLF